MKFKQTVKGECKPYQSVERTFPAEVTSYPKALRHEYAWDLQGAVRPICLGLVVAGGGKDRGQKEDEVERVGGSWQTSHCLSSGNTSVSFTSEISRVAPSPFQTSMWHSSVFTLLSQDFPAHMALSSKEAEISVYFYVFSGSQNRPVGFPLPPYVLLSS